MTDREIVAEFMGIEKCIHGWYDRDMLLQQEVYNASNGSIHEELMFDESWDWLMPVVVKVRNIYRVTKEMNEITSMMYHINDNLLNSDNINDTYVEVVEFIKWYNKNKE